MIVPHPAVAPTAGPASSTTAGEAAVVRACLAGDQAAWEALVERHQRYVHAICVRTYRLSPHDAEDVFQETFARLVEHLPRLRDPGAVGPWVAQVARRCCLDRLRRVREVPGDVVEPDDAGRAMAELEAALAVHQALAALPEDAREVLDRFFCRDQSYGEIGAALGIPPGTIASRISRGLARLRETLEP